MSIDYYHLTKVQLEDGTKLCLKKVLTILDDVEVLCSNNGSESSSVSLYTIAIEEYGKFLLLNEILNIKSDSISQYAVNKSIFGKGKSHKQKFIKAIANLPEVCVEYHIRDICENENLLPPVYRERMLTLRTAINDLRYNTGIRARGTILLTFDFEVRKNLLYVDWNEKMNSWSTELIKDQDVEYYDIIDELEEDRDRDTSLDEEWERKLETSEEEADSELEDVNLDVEDVNYQNVRRLEYPKNLIYAVKFFKKYIKQSYDQ
jgi:AbiV family abortive infection protein